MPWFGKKTMQELAFMQMQEWIHTIVLMAIALVSSPERNSPYLGFCCRRRMEFQTKTLFSTILSWWRIFFIAFTSDSSNSLRRILRLAFL